MNAILDEDPRLASSILLWLQLSDAVSLSYYVVFSPIFGLEAFGPSFGRLFSEVFYVIASFITFTAYFQRSSAGWAFYWNRRSVQACARTPCAAVSEVYKGRCAGSSSSPHLRSASW